MGTNLPDVKCGCVFIHLSTLAGDCVCVLLPIGYFPHASAVVTVGVLVEVRVLPDAEAKQLLIFIQFGLSWSCFCQRRAEGWALCWQEERTIKDRLPAEKKQCIRFSKRCRYQQFWIAWPGPAFPLAYLSSQEPAPGKKWWKATQYLNASQPNKFTLLFGFDMNIEKTPSEARIVVWRWPNGRLLTSAW